MKEVRGMSLFLGTMSQHIPGKKELSEHAPLLKLLPKKEAYIPLFGGKVTDLEVLVEEGQEVKIGTKLAQTTSGFYVPIYSSVSGTTKNDFTGFKSDHKTRSGKNEYKNGGVKISAETVSGSIHVEKN